MKLLKLIIFFLFFNIQVKVKASRFLGGEQYYSTAGSQKIEFLYGQVNTEDAKFWLIKNSSGVEIRSVEGNVKVVSLDGRVFNLTNGFQMTVGPVTTEGKNWIEVPRPIDIEEHLKMWKTNYKGSDAEFKTELKKFKTVWKNAVEMSSAAYQNNALRSIASAKKVEEEQRQKLLKEQSDRVKLKQKFYEKSLGR